VTDATGTVFLGDGKGGKSAFLTDFETEHWKSNDTGKKWYKVGPLSSVWVGDQIAVTNAGLADGEETVLFFDKSGKAKDGKATNSVGPTTDEEADKGEGNLCGLSATKDGSTLYVAGQGFDGKSWILKVDVASKKLTGAFSADEHGIETNSPMETVVTESGNVLALYSGTGGKVAGRLVEWDPKTGKPVNQWEIPELVNPMGMAPLNGSQVVMVENNWDLKKVQKGRVAIVTLGKNGNAVVEETGVMLDGPVSCAFGPDERLYVSQLGPEFDSDKGSVIAIKGLK
jgi:hypothetical protein